MVVIVFARIGSARVEEQLSLYPLHGLMMGVAKNDHIGVGVVLGKVLIIAFKAVALLEGRPFIKQVVQHGPVSMCYRDPDTKG